MAHVLEKNVELIDMLKREVRTQRTSEERISDSITSFSGSMVFVYIHVVWFVVWIAINMVPGLPKFDPFPFGLLTMIVSLEAIFLSTFVLISQNREALMTEEQSTLDLQIDLLSEYEVTRVLRLIDKIAMKLGIEDEHDSELEELCEPTAPEIVFNEIRNQHESA